MKKKLLAVFFIFVFTIASYAQVITIRNPKTVPIKLLRVSKALRDLPESAPTERQLRGRRLEHENPALEHQMKIVNENALPVGADPALQRNNEMRTAATASANILSTWTGLTAAVDPSDNTIAVGPNHVMQMTNSDASSYIRIWSKSGTVLVNNITAQSISGVNDYGDPNLLYDPAADRFLFVTLFSGSASKLVVCISQTPDPTGSYYVYSFNTPNGFPDYPKIAVWDNSYIITTNSDSPTIMALDRSAIIAGQSMGTVQMFSLSSFPTLGFQSASPVTQTGNLLPPAGEPAVVIRVADDAWGGSVGSDHLELFQVSIDWTNSANSTITGPINLSTIAYNSNLCGFDNGNCIRQPNTSRKLDPLSDIMMDKVQYRNIGDYESIVCSHVCNADGLGTAGIRWYELRRDISGNWNIYQQSTYSPDTTGRFMSSITINQNGTIALGYNVSGTMVSPGFRITGRDSCDALNLMTVDETVATAGSSHNSSSRYGDYNGLVTDPVDGSFWMTGNYNVSTSWSTNVVNFSFADCIVAEVLPVESSSQHIHIIPNPSSGQIIIAFDLPVNETVPLQIFDATGKIIFEQTFHLQKENVSLSLNLDNLSNGFYFLKMSAGKDITFQKFIIQR